MKALIKIVGSLIVVMVLLVVAAVVLIPMLFDPNDHKAELAAKVKEHTGRDLKIDGDIGLSVFPWLGLELGVVELGNAPGFSDPFFARTEKVNVRLKLMPLLDRRIVMDTVSLHGVAVNLERKADGSNNFTFGEASEAKPESSSDTGASDVGLAGIAIGGLDLRDGAISWKDGQAGQAYKLSNVRVQTGALTPGEPVALDLSFDLAGGKPTMSGRVELTGAILSDIAAKSHRVDGLALKVNLTGQQFPNGALNATVTANVLADLMKQTAKVEGLEVASGALKLNGNLDVSGLDKAPTYQGKFTLASLNPKSLMSDLGMAPIQTADASALTALAADFGLSGTTTRAALKPLNITLDQTKIGGQVEIADFARSALRFNLDIDGIDADRYLPPSAKGKGATSPGGAATQAADIPTKSLRGLDVAGTAKLGKLKISNLSMTQIVATVKAQGGAIRLHPVSAKLYEGSYSGDIRLDARKDTPLLSLNETLQGVQAGPLLKDLNGEERLTGTTKMTARLTASGKNPDAMKGTLGGRVRFDFTNGALKGVNIAQMIREAKAKLTGGTVAAQGPNQTDFSELGATLNISKGRARNDDFLAKSPFLRIGGKGEAHLVKETVNYLVTASVVATGKGQGGKELDDLKGLDIPVRVTGTFQEPKYGLDFDALAASFAKSKASAVVAKQKEAIKAKAKAAVSEKLGNIVGGATGGSKDSDGKATDKIGGALKGLFKN